MNCHHVLIVEDDPDIREVLHELLELEGYHIFEAENGQEGLNMLGVIPRPCLVLLDMMMPVMSGWEFIQRKTDDIIIASIPVIVVSAFTDTVKNNAVKAVVKKPVDIAVLLRHVRKYCGCPQDRSHRV